jgi:hypothetical protein
VSSSSSSSSSSALAACITGSASSSSVETFVLFEGLSLSSGGGRAVDGIDSEEAGASYVISPFDLS